MHNISYTLFMVLTLIWWLNSPARWIGHKILQLKEIDIFLKSMVKESDGLDGQLFIMPPIPITFILYNFYLIRQNNKEIFFRTLFIFDSIGLWQEQNNFRLQQLYCTSYGCFQEILWNCWFTVKIRWQFSILNLHLY